MFCGINFSLDLLLQDIELFLRDCAQLISGACMLITVM